MELTSYEVPLTPQFITEEGNVSDKTFSIEWAPFQGASSYQLLKNGEQIYSGIDTTFEIENIEDGQFEFQINAIISDDFDIKGDILTLDVFYILPPPTISSSDDDITLGDEVTLSWESVENPVWFSLIIQNGNNEPVEIYNGSETEYSTSELDLGLNRIRISVGSSDGKVSELSDSIFVNVEEADSSSSLFSELNTPIILFAIIAITMVAVLIFERGE
jgi:hypothetical protein